MSRLTTAQAAKRLGVKPATIYAYVSRGILASSAVPGDRYSTFSSREIEQLALRGKPRQASRSHALDFAIDTAITEIGQHSLSYRGHDVLRLASSATFEQVAGLLLDGSLGEHITWDHRPIEVPSTSSIFDHVGLVPVLLATNDPMRGDLSPEAVRLAARNIMAAVVDSLPSVGEGRTPRLQIGEKSYRSTIAGRLWTKLSPARPTPALMSILNAALVLLADHELAVSAVAARVTASTRADPYAVVSAGIAAMSGPLHGGASRGARRMLDQALHETTRATSGSDRAVGEALATLGNYPGFGHTVYKQGDPRAESLLAMLRETAGGTRPMNAVDGVIAAIRKRRDIQPNIDLALAALGLVANLPTEASESIFCVARIAGWCAHAIEEYNEAPLRFRARALYVG
jgi:citrate synthase